jgi:hypothetical protein
MTNDQIRLHFGELNADEMRLARAIVDWYEAREAKLRAAADDMFAALNDCREDTCELIAERDWWKEEPRCRYDVRYQEMKDRLNAAIAALAAYQATKP